MTNEPSIRIEVTDKSAAERARAHVKIGNRFVFADGGGAPSSSRLSRLLGRSGGTGTKKVFALATRPVDFQGFRVHPSLPSVEPLHALVTDRDLYRAEEDTVNLFLAMPQAPAGLKLIVELAGDVFTERLLDKEDIPSLAEHGVHIEPLSMLLAGDYTAQLAIGDRRIGQAVSFTVAEYTLAPLTGRLLSHELDSASGQLTFTLAVESYEQPFDRGLRVELLSGGEVVDETELEAETAGRYRGALRVSGDKGLRLRLVGREDAERTCDVVIPGSRKHERQVTVVSELGDEKLLSLMPAAGALPLRGAYLTDGDFLSTPVVVDEVVTARGRLQVRSAMSSLTTLTVNLENGSVTAKEHGDKEAGDVVELDVPGSACTVFVGGWVGDRAFEAFTHLFRPAKLELDVTAVHNADSKTLTVKLNSNDDRRRPMLVCVRDERLTATDTPEVALSASAKRSIDVQTKGFGDDWALHDLAQEEPWSWLRHGVARVDLDATPPDVGLLGQMEIDTVHFLRAVPVMKAGGKLIVATSQPDMPRVEEVMQHQFPDAEVEVRWTGEPALKRFIKANRADFLEVLPVMRSGAPGAMLRFSVQESGAFGAGAAPDMDDFDDLLDEGDDLQDEVPAVSVDVEWEESTLTAGLPPQAAAAAAPAFKESKKMGRSIPATPAAPASLAPLDGARDRPVAELLPTPTERTTFPEVIFYGLIDVAGDETLELPLADALGTFTLEVFALGDGDWARTKETVVVDQPVRIDLDLPPAVFPDDIVTATLRAAAGSGEARVTLTCDGKPVALRAADGAPIAAGASLPSPCEARFRVTPGEYVARVEDVATGETDSVNVLVGTPGELRTYAKEVGFLQPGDTLNLFEAGDDILSLRVLPGLKETTSCLVQATAGYAHLCSEQTAAKILSATAMYLTAEDAKTKGKAEKIILSGIEREKKMYLPGKGFGMYPGERSPNDYWGSMAVRHLWRLRQLVDVPSLSPALRRAAAEGVAMADDAGRGHGVERVPTSIRTTEDAYLVATAEPGRAREAAKWVQGAVVFGDGEPRLKDPRGAVHNRYALSYAAAVLLITGELKDGVRAADIVLRQLGSEGRLYSTVDSVAAIALVIELERAGIGRGDAEVTVNGKRMSALAAAGLTDQIETLEVHSGVCAIELNAIRSESWSALSSSFGVRVGFRDKSGGKKRTFRQGDRAELVVELREGYQVGDLVHVALPAALSWLRGGGRVQQFTVDFEGETEVRVPLLVTGRIEGKQHFAVCVRNMFEEERASNPGLLSVAAVA